MINKILYTSFLLLSCLLLSSALVNAQSVNWLNNPYADANTDDWTAVDNATIEQLNGNPSFVVRNGGYFSQEIPLPSDLSEEFMLIIGLVSSERINPSGYITGLPYFYAYELESVATSNSYEQFINQYINVNNMLQSSPDTYDWVLIWDIFAVPDYTDTVQLFLMQAEQKGIPHNGSAARFDDLGVYFFKSVDEAESFINEYYL